MQKTFFIWHQLWSEKSTSSYVHYFRAKQQSLIYCTLQMHSRETIITCVYGFLWIVDMLACNRWWSHAMTETEIFLLHICLAFFFYFRSTLMPHLLFFFPLPAGGNTKNHLLMRRRHLRRRDHDITILRLPAWRELQKYMVNIFLHFCRTNITRGPWME